MDAILMSLMTALNEKLLINVYQRDTDDFYTGYVQLLGKQSVLLATYNDAGLADGAVLIAFPAIEQVEFAGDDLVDMSFRMRVAAEHHFIGLAPQKPLAFDPRQNLLHQLALHAQTSGEVILVILADDDSYLEGQVTAVADDRLTLSVFNKFNYTDVRYLQVDFSDVLVVECEGLELHLETELLKQRNQLQHVRTEITQNDGQLEALFNEAQQSGQLLAAMPRNAGDQFYVGAVKAVNTDTVVLRLKDMAGQFGGYVALRLTSIQSVITASDYLQTVKAYSDWMTAHHLEKQPVLNADREFDRSEDLFRSLINEAAAFERVVRVRVQNENAHLMGIPENPDQTGFEISVPSEDEPVAVTFDEVQEIAFGHIYAYLQEARAHQTR